MSEKNPPPANRRHTETEAIQVGDYFDSTKRYYDQVNELTVVKIISGEYYVTNQPSEVIMTILGSCISACIRDPIAKVGGMNHFLLPGDTGSADNDSARFGAYAMEILINEILKKGGRKERLEVKLFGGGNVIGNSAKIGDKNVAFVRDYVKREGLKIATEDLGGDLPRRINYYPDTGKVMMRRIGREEDKRIIQEEKLYEESLKKQKKESSGDVELF